MAESSQKRIENSVGKGEIVCYELFLLFPHCFQVMYCKHRNKGWSRKGKLFTKWQNFGLDQIESI